MAITLNGVSLEQPPKWWGFDLVAWETTLGGWCAPQYRTELIEAISGYSYIRGGGVNGQAFQAVEAPGVGDNLAPPLPASLGTPTGNRLVTPAGVPMYVLSGAGAKMVAGHLSHDFNIFKRGVTPSNQTNYTLVVDNITYYARSVSMRWGALADGENRFTMSFTESAPRTTAATLVAAATGDVSGGDMEIGAGLTNSALIGIVGRHGNTDPDTVRWTVGATVQNATFVNKVSGTDVGVGLYYVLNPTPGIGNFAALGGSLGGYWVGFWVLEDVNQVTPISAYTFGTGTGTTTAITGSASGGALVLDGFYVGHADFVDDGHPALPTPSAGQTLDSRGSLQLGPPGYSDWLIGISHGDLTPAWTQDQSRPWAGVVIATNGI